MNEHDSDKMRLMLAHLGYESCDDPFEASLILYNTCTIREKAYHKAVSELGRAREYKIRRPDVIIGVCGCVAQQDGDALLSRFRYVDLVFGPDQISQLPTLLAASRSKQAKALDLINDREEYTFIDEVPTTTQGPCAFVSIMKGCNCACSYCIVPSVRGREVCRSPDEILAEVRALCEIGVKEITLLGQNVNAYRDPTCEGKRGSGLAPLIKKLSAESSIMRLRFQSPHPRDVDDALIEEYRDNEKLMPHMHLPVQSGSNSVLARMRRGYTRERYIEIVDALRAARPNISISTDFIAGFCGESAEEFEETLDLTRRIEFDSCFAFKYSPRRGTEAFDFADDVSSIEKDRRLEAILHQHRDVAKRKNVALIGRSELALAYEIDKMKGSLISGRLPSNRIVHFSGDEDSIGRLVQVKIVGANVNSLMGEVIR